MVGNHALVARTLGMFALALALFPAARAEEPEETCVKCHEKLQPGIVGDWKASRHAESDVDCATCHGTGHTTSDDVDKVRLPTPQVCGECHEERLKEYASGKHAIAWAAMKAMPTFHWQPMTLTEGREGCGGCHKIGLKSEEEIRTLKEHGVNYGVAACDSCHTRHTFSAQEARQPEACRSCHMGFDHPQWEMYSSSKHGVRFALKRRGDLPESAAAPTCQTCHMPDGHHSVRTAWGFLGVRLPLPKDHQWAEDRIAILKALGVLDPKGEPTARLETVRAADVARLDEESWQAERDRMLDNCSKCHSRDFAAKELAKGDRMIQEADHLMAEAIRIVAALYADGILVKPQDYRHAYPDLLTFHDAPTEIEQKLFVMFLKHRMRAFQGSFHSNPDYSLWYGWSELQRDLTSIYEKAKEMRWRADRK